MFVLAKKPVVDIGVPPNGDESAANGEAVVLAVLELNGELKAGVG